MTTVMGMTGNQADYTAPARGNPGGEMGKDVFLQLMVTQMRHQDPLAPQDSGDMMAQLAQFTALEQMQNLNASMNKLLSMQGVHQLSLLGKEVTARAADGEEVSGIVTALRFQEDMPLMLIKDRLFPLEQLFEIKSGVKDE